MKPDRDLSHLYPPFRERVELVLKGLQAYAKVHMPGYRWIVTEGFRSSARQQELYAQGRTLPGAIVTHKNGTSNESNHQSSLSVDVAPVKGKKLDYAISDVHWKYLGHLCRAHGLTWGADWDSDGNIAEHSFQDRPHIEWRTTDKATYRKAREWQVENGLRKGGK